MWEVCCILLKKVHHEKNWIAGTTFFLSAHIIDQKIIGISIQKDNFISVLMPLNEEIHGRLTGEQPVFSAKTMTLKRSKTKQYKDLNRSECKSPIMVTVTNTDKPENKELSKKRYLYESGTYNLLLNPEILSDENIQALFVVLLVRLLWNLLEFCFILNSLVNVAHRNRIWNTYRFFWLKYLYSKGLLLLLIVWFQWLDTFTKMKWPFHVSCSR